MSPRDRSRGRSAISTLISAGLSLAPRKTTFPERRFPLPSGSTGHAGSGPGCARVRLGLSGVGKTHRPALAGFWSDAPAGVGSEVTGDSGRMSREGGTGSSMRGSHANRLEKSTKAARRIFVMAAGRTSWKTATLAFST
jgi:hypothetical protein